MRNKLRIAAFVFIALGMILGSVPQAMARPAATKLSLDLWWMPVERPYFPDAKSVALIMQANLAAIGVETTLISYDWGEYLDRTDNGEHDMCLLGWSADIAHPDNFLHVLLHGDSAVVGTAHNVAFYNNSEVNTLLSAARAETDYTAAATLYQDAQWIIYKDTPWVTVAHSQNNAGYNNTMTGFQTHPTGPGSNVYANVTLGTETSITIARGGDSVTLDPAEFDDGQSWKVARQIYDGLYNMPPDSVTPEPALATNYSVSADLKTWNFSLRQGVTFHDGTPFNSSAVVFSFERAKYGSYSTTDNATDYVINEWTPPEIGYYDYIYDDAMNITEIDEFTVQFSLPTSYAPFLDTLAMGVFSIVSPSYVKTNNGTQNVNRIGEKPRGTGPFMLEDGNWAPDSLITLTENTAYWGGPSVNDEIIFKVIPEAATRVGELQAGTVDIVDNLAAPDATVVDADTDLTLASQAGMNVGYLAMNRLRYPFNDTTPVADPDFGGMTTRGDLISRAFSYAIDRDLLINIIYQGRALKAKNPLPPSFWGYNDTIPHRDYDPERAMAILHSLGFEVTTPPTTSLTPITSISTSVSVSVTTSVVTRQVGFDPFTTIIASFGAFAVIVITIRRRKKK
ncbi:MAG: ABC transporter substrate-binding protein [Candidatus Hodarchaeales archaeon]